MALINDLDMTLIPLDYFRKMMGVDPYHFWQMVHPDHELDNCERIYTHERWQLHQAGRYDMLTALQEAESNIADLIRFWPAPKYYYRESTELAVPRLLERRWIRPLTLHTKWSKIQQVGVQQWDIISAGVVLAYDATDNVSFSIAVTDDVEECEVVVTYPDTQVSIRPISVSIANNLATITIKKWLLGDPELWESGVEIDATDTNNLLATVDVYQVWYSQIEQILLYWEPVGASCGCLSSSCPICTGCTTNACATPSTKAYNIGTVPFQVATYADGVHTAGTSPQSRYPDYTYISYLSGAPLEGDCYMSRFWQRIISHYGIALLDLPLCECNDVTSFYNYWQQVPGSDAAPGEPFPDISPLGSARRGAIEAWYAIKRLVEL